tara:strand:- start:22 stop:762 length:741 start_codon:yes stop_codon:yes gene_type:complete
MKITVVVPCYNSMKYLEQCITSVLNQDYEGCDIWACDNESTDGTYEYLLDLEKNNENLKVFQFPNVFKNGYREAMEYVFENSDNDYITFIASDDYVAPDYISKYMKIISYDPDNIKCIQSGIIGVQADKQINKQIHFYRNIEEFKQLCLQRSPVNTPSVIFHKSLWPVFQHRPALFDSNLPIGGPEDYDQYCNLADNKIFIYPVNACLGYFYRWHEDQSTWKVHASPLLKGYEKIIQEYWKKKWTL